MYGAMLGDVVGSVYEFSGNNKTKDFPFLTDKSHFTDDTVMTFAVANGLLAEELDETDDEVIKKSLIKAMQAWGKAFSHCSYGRRFKLWLYQENPEPINSYGNGSAMRVSSIGWLYDTIERTRHVARLSAIVSHNHVEGIKGAEAVASAVFLARIGKSKEDIKEYIEREFNYNLSRSLYEIRPNYHHIESSQESVPESIICFLEGISLIDTIRNAVSLGGDSDTQACIAASIGEAYWGIEESYKTLLYKNYMTVSMKQVMDFFETVKKERIKR